jgi:rRNA maturation endonuclease Nob1
LIHLLLRLCIESIRTLTGERQRFERELEEVAEQRVVLEEELARSQAQLRVLQADAEDVEAREQELQHQRDILGLNASDAERGTCFLPIKIIKC